MSDFVEVGGEGGREKPFVMAKNKTPAEQAREKNMSMMPQVRFDVSKLRIAAAAKWLFDRFSDDSFRDDRGGDGYGSVWTTIKDLSVMYHHDRERIATWLKVLVDAGVVWIERDRGYLVVHLASFVPPPTVRSSMVARLRARASRSARVANPDTDNFFAKIGHPAQEVAETDADNPDFQLSVWQNATQPAGDSPTPCGKSGYETPENATRRVANPVTSCGISPHDKRQKPPVRAGDSRIEGAESSITTGQRSSPKTSPSKETGELEKKGEGTRPPEIEMENAFTIWERRLDDMRNSDLRKLEEIAAREFHNARSDEARENGKRKLVAIRLRLRGPSVSDQPAPKPKPARSVIKQIQERELSSEEILQSARSAIALGMKAAKLTNSQREALARVGELA